MYLTLMHYVSTHMKLELEHKWNTILLTVVVAETNIQALSTISA